MTAELVELEEISVCPECCAREWLVIETRSSNGPFCRCARCGWQDPSVSAPNSDTGPGTSE